MIRDEGIIKFDCSWDKQLIPIEWDSTLLISIRQKLYQVQLIGAYEDNIGFGNISIRVPDSDQFIISGSSTGNLSQLSKSDFSLVISADINKNKVSCVGETIASSESMTHATIYQHDKMINAIVHAHHKEIWNDLLYKVPTISEKISYGTPGMAKATQNILEQKTGLFCMAGHEDGIVAYSESLEQAASLLLKLTE